MTRTEQRKAEMDAFYQRVYGEVPKEIATGVRVVFCPNGDPGEEWFVEVEGRPHRISEGFASEKEATEAYFADTISWLGDC